MKNSYYLFVLIFFALSACGSPKSTAAKFKIKLGHITGTYPGGLILSGKNLDNGNSFTEIVSSPDLTKSLSSGRWKFYSIMWTGNSDFNGTPKCSLPLEVSISGETAEVNLNLTQSNCLLSEYAIPNSFYSGALYNNYIGLCHPSMTKTQLDSFQYCSISYNGQATGAILRMESFDNFSGTSSSNKLTSQCLPVSSGNISLGFAIPTFPASDGHFPTKIEIFYSPTYPSSCSGAECCQGRSITYSFPKSLANYSIPNLSLNAYQSIYLIEQAPELKIKFSGSVTTTPQYKTCSSLNLELLDSNGNPALANSAVTTNLNCNGSCVFYSDNTCTTTITQSTIAQGSSSTTVYIRPISSSLTLVNNGAGVSIAGDNKNNIPVVTTFASLDYQYVFPTMPSSVLSLTPFATNEVIAFQTYNGNRGRMIINNVSTTSTTNDTITFSYDTWDSSGNLIATGANITSVAAFSGGTCLGDLDLNGASALYGTSNSGFTDFWWENLSGSLYFNPQGSASFVKIQ